MKIQDKLPPMNIEAEQHVLGAIILDGETIFKAISILNQEDFYRQPHRIIFSALYSLKSRGEKIDLLTLRDELEKSKDLVEVGGVSYLAELIDMTPTAANIEGHAKIVHEKATLRNLNNVALGIHAACMDSSGEFSNIIAAAEEKIFAVTQGNIKKDIESFASVMQDAYSMIEEAAANKGRVGISTDFCDIDRIIPGLEGGKLYYLAARPAMGKTSLAMNILENISMKSGLPVLCFSREMLNKEVGFRSLCGHAEVDSTLAKQGKLEQKDMETLARSAHILSGAKIFLDDSARDTIVDIHAKARRAKAEHGIACIVVDYLQLVTSSKTHENQNIRIGNISFALKLMAMELDVPVLCLSQLNREVEKRPQKRPQLSDLRDSGSIEQDADVVMFLYRPEVYFDNAPKGIAELIIAKHRGGAIGTVYLGFKPEFTKFYSLEQTHQEGPF